MKTCLWVYRVFFFNYLKNILKQVSILSTQKKRKFIVIRLKKILTRLPSFPRQKSFLNVTWSTCLIDSMGTINETTLHVAVLVCEKKKYHIISPHCYKCSTVNLRLVICFNFWMIKCLVDVSIYSNNQFNNDYYSIYI